MAQEVNIFDPLGIAKAVRNQVNTVATKVNLPPLPEMPAVNMKMGPMSVFNPFNRIPNRPGYDRESRV